MNPYQGLLNRIGGTRAFAWFGRKVLTPVDKRMKGKKWSITTFGTDYPLCHLTTTGRRSGEPRTSPLLWVEAGDDVAVVGSNWGTANHPGWTHNLLADPTAVLTIGQDERTVRARLVDDAAEAERIWEAFAAIYPGYRTYRKRTSRDIRLFVLDPATPTL